MTDQPTSWRVGRYHVAPSSMDDEDPRGILWVWEQPRSTETYIVSVDPTVGKTGWSREFRTEADQLTDNAAIEILRAGRHGAHDAQVAEFAAPMDSIDLAPIVATLGRVYAGANEDGMAQVIGELNGPGAILLREMLDKFQYYNLWLWTQWGNAQTRRTNQYWWWSSRDSSKDLWIRGLHHINKRRVQLRSPWLIEEMADCVADVWLAVGEARYGRHDDRVLALLMNLWAMHDWSNREDVEPLERATDENAPKWEATDVSASEMADLWAEKVSAILDND